MIAKIKTRADFGGIVNYANDQKNKKKCATLLAYEGVCAISNKTIAECSDIMDFMIFQADFDIYYGISDVYESTPYWHISTYLFFKTLLTTLTEETSLLVEVNTSTFHT